MKKSLWGALLVFALVYVPASASGAGQRRVLADLKVMKVEIKQLPGDPPYVVEDEQGHTPGFAVFVTIRNIGKGTAKASSTGLDIERLGGSRVRGLARRVARLRPKATYVSRFVVDLDFNGRPPPLGVLRVVATANVSKTFIEDRSNNELDAKHLLPVIAHQWKAFDLMTTESLSNVFGLPGSLMTDATRVCPEVDCGRYFVFRFSTFDEASKHFVYTPSGTVRASASFLYAPLSCTGQGSAVSGPRDWPGSLWIDDGLDYYNASVGVKSIAPPPDRFWVDCMGTPTLQVEWAWQDLLTYVGDKQFPRTDSPYSTRLTGHTEKTSVAGVTTTWQWTLRADVPGA